MAMNESNIWRDACLVRMEDSVPQPHHCGVLPNKTVRWTDVEDDLAILLDNDEIKLLAFAQAHTEGLKRSIVLVSLALLVSSQAEASSFFSRSVATFAYYLADPKIKRATKLVAVRLLMHGRSPVDAGWQLAPVVLDDTLNFILTNGQQQPHWPYYPHSEEVLLWQLRAVVQHQLALQRKKHAEELQRIQNGADLVSSYITGGARGIQCALGESTRLLTDTIDFAGQVAKASIEPCKETILDSHLGALTVSYTNVVQQLTESTRDVTKRAVNGIKDASVRGIHLAGERLQEHHVAEKLVPHPKGRAILAAAGQIGMVSIGAAAIVGEAVLESTADVVYATTLVTADIVQHKYGPSGGQIVRDASSSAGNVFKTVGHVGMFKGAVLTKAVARDTGKQHIKRRTTPELELASLQSQKDDASGHDTDDTSSDTDIASLSGYREPAKAVVRLV